MKNNLRHVLYLSVICIGMCFSMGRAWGQAPPGYRLIWSDEFNGATIDPSNWGFDIGGSGWGNNELQYYTNRPENAFLSNGNLVIEARKESYEGRNYTSARLLTKGKRDFLFGRIDIRAKLPKGQGIWPALWSLGKNIDQVGWPACGEMDILELLGHEPNKMYSTVHWAPPGGGATNLPANYVLPSGDFTQDFHLFSMVWERDIIKFYVDDILITTVTRANITGNYPFNDPFFLIFNVAVGGFWPGNPDATTTFPQRMYVDYVRVFQQESSLAGPTLAAPTPTEPASRVISLFSNAYTNVAVDTWSAPWDVANVEEVSVVGNATKKYTNLTFAGVEFHTPGPVINATSMERFHADIWTPDASSLKLKLVDFGANGVYGGGDDTEHELAFAPTLGNWYSIDVPLSSFTGLTSRAHLAQLIIVGDGGNKSVWVDNVYLYKLPPSEPTVAAPTPTQAAANVKSLYSNVYTNLPVDTWSAPWDQADIEDVTVAGNATKKYSNLNYAGIEFHSPGPVVDASTMERFHMDVWTSNASTVKVKLVDFGANGAYGGGDDTEHELSFTPTLGEWLSIDVPLTDFANMTSRSHIAQLIIVGGGGKTIWVDNVYFYRTGTVPTEPLVAAPTPTHSSSNVISLFSNAYTNVAVDTWSAVWDVADVSDVMVAGNATKKYSNLTFAGVEFHTPGPVVNATTMERFHADVWTANASTFKVKLVDFGANGTFGGGDDTEHELTFNPTLNSWFSIDVPLSNFTGMTSKAHIAQLIFVGEGGGKTVWVDNVYFYRNTVPAPTVSLSPMGNCGTPVDFSGTANCGSSTVVWYNATTNEALPNLPAKTPTVTTSYYARCKSADNQLSDKSEVVVFTVVSQVATPTITVSQAIVCTGTTVTVSANCPAGSKAFWNTGVNENSLQVAFNNVTQQSFKAKCVFAGGCESGESNAKTVRWKAFDLTFINIGQSKSAVKASDNRSEWQSQFITPDGGPVLEESSQPNPTLYFAENTNKTAPRFWTIQAEACALGTSGSLTYDLLSTPETGIVRSYNTHENNAPYFMYGNRDGFTELYAQNHPAYGFYEVNGAGANVYDDGFPKGLYKLSVRYWDQKGEGSIYPATRKPQGNVLAYQEYWFRIQSKDGIGVGAAREGTNDNGPMAIVPSMERRGLTILPNPVTNILRLQVQDSKGKEVKATLLDASGRKVLGRSFVPETNTHHEEFEVGSLVSGMYFLQVTTPEKQATLKVVKVD